MKKSLIALAFGTLGLGIAEFVMMGILPNIAADLHISIEQAGHFISAYALGVCCGAPCLVLSRKFPLKSIIGTGWGHYRRQPVRLLRTKLRNDATGPFYLWTASRRLLRSSLNRCRKTGR